MSERKIIRVNTCIAAKFMLLKKKRYPVGLVS